MSRELPIIKAINISKVFQKSKKLYIRAIEDVSIEINSNDSVGIVGESGCGKTTLLRIMSASIVPDQGSVSLLGLSAKSTSQQIFRRARQNISVVYQSILESVNPRMKLGEIVLEPLAYRKRTSREDRMRRIRNVFDFVEVPLDYAKRYPHEVSAGEIQRICIARALISEPRLILFDEPTSSLDVIAQMRIIALIKRLREERMLAYVFVSHNISAVRMLCNRIIVMQRGKFVDEGSIEDLLLRSMTEYTRILLNSATVRAA